MNFTPSESLILRNLLAVATAALKADDRAELAASIEQVANLLQAPTDAAGAAEEGTALEAESPTIHGRIQAQRDELFGVEAAIGVAQRSVNPDKEYDLWRVLGDAYAAIDTIATELDDIATDARREGGAP